MLRNMIILLLLATVCQVRGEDCGYHSQILPDAFSPIHYELDFTAHMVMNRFSGQLDIALRSHRTMNRQLILHSGSNIIISELLLYLSKGIDSEEVDLNKRIRTDKICKDDKLNLLVIDFHEDGAQMIQNGSILILRLRYHGMTPENGKGLARINHQSSENPEQAKRFLFTRFERFGAHYVFPCFDEPKYKARISFIMDQVLPPRRVASITRFRLTNWTTSTGLEFQRYTFDPTPPISIHQFGFAMGFFEVPDQFLHSEGLEQSIQVIKHLGASNVNQFAALSLRKAHWNLNSFFGTPHPADVLKIICIPGIAAISMESLELAGTLIIDPARLELDQNEIETAMFTASLVKMLTRQWFGYMLTLESEEQAWLLEGLVGWTALRITDKIILGLSYKLIYAQTMMSPAMTEDAQPNKPAMIEKTLPVGIIGPGFIEPVDEVELRSTKKLDERLVVKATSIIGMAEEYCAGHFVEALQILMENFKEKTFKLSDFYEAITFTCRHRSPQAAIESFLNNPGFPLVKATIDKRRDVMLVSQERFKPDYTGAQTDLLSMASLSLSDTDNEILWVLPLSYTQANKFLKNKDKRLASHLLPEVPTVIPIELPDKYSAKNIGAWVKMNNFGRGFYRVLYSDAMLTSLINAVNDNQLTILDFYQLIDDASALFHAGKVGSYYVIETLKLMQTQRNEILQDAMITAYSELRKLYLNSSPSAMIDQMNSFGINLFGRVFVERKFKFDLITTRTGIYGLLRTYEMLAILDFEPIIRISLEIYRNNHLLNLSNLFHDTIFIAVVRHGTVHEFTGLLAVLKHPNMQKPREVELKMVKAFALARERPRLQLAWRHIKGMSPDLVYHFIINLVTTREGSELIVSEVSQSLRGLYDTTEPNVIYNILEQICINVPASHDICEPGSLHEQLLGRENWHNLVVNVREIRRKRYILSQIDLNKLTF